ESIRMALIQSLGEVPGWAGRVAVRDRIQAHVLDLYQRDPAPGVHGSAKWLLLRWDLAERLREIDDRLAKSPVPAGQRWRIGPLGLTVVTIIDRSLGRILEVSDTEVTVDQFLRFRKDHRYKVEISPKGECPINSVDYYTAAAFCNWLSELEPLPPECWCYG